LVFECLLLLVCLDMADHPIGHPPYIMERYAGLQAGAGQDVFLYGELAGTETGFAGAAYR
jgi:hypothetical protein